VVEAAERWRAALGALAIPQSILDGAPESPYGFPTALFRTSAAAARALDLPARRRAVEALPDGGSVLDVGAGGGAASLALVPPAGRIIAVDPSEDLISAFTSAAGELDVSHHEVLGRWPDVAPEVELADVVVCHHVFYNAPDLEDFAAELTDHAACRVVVEMTARHPMTELNDLWRHFHHIERPSQPTSQDAYAVLDAMGLEVRVEQSRRPSLWSGASRAEVIAFIRKRLCLTASHDSEIGALIGDEATFGVRSVTTMWWDVSGG